MAEVKGFASRRGYRGKPRSDLDALANAVSALPRPALSPHVAEAEIIPVAVRPRGAGVLMLDALLRTREDATT